MLDLINTTLAVGYRINHMFRERLQCFYTETILHFRVKSAEVLI